MGVRGTLMGEVMQGGWQQVQAALHSPPRLRQPPWTLRLMCVLLVGVRLLIFSVVCVMLPPFVGLFRLGGSKG